MRETPYKEFRKDGWPLCPQCGDDELYSDIMLTWSGEGKRPTIEDCIAGGMACYHCHWFSEKAELEKRLAELFTPAA